MLSNTHKKKIAVVIPAYNVQNYLEECLTSLQSQSYCNFTAFIVNDGSTDATGEIANKFSIHDSRFKVTHTANSGVATARNIALDQIEKDGSFFAVAFLDGDDRLHPDCLNRAVIALEQKQVDCAIFGYRVFDKSGFIESESYSPSDCLLKSNTEIYDHFFNCNKTQPVIWFLLNKVFRSTLLTGIRFNRGMKRGEDVRFFVDLKVNLNSAVLLSEPLLDYRLRKSSLTHKDMNLLWDAELLSTLILSNSSSFSASQKAILTDTLLNAWRKSIIYVYSQNPSPSNILFIKKISKKLSNAGILHSIKSRKRLFYLSLGTNFMKWWATKRYKKIMKNNQTNSSYYYE